MWVLTDEPPSVPGLVDVHLRCVKVRRVAEEWQPHVFDMKIVKRLSSKLSERNTVLTRLFQTL